jgi:nucleotide-binding universal stress UspA family protein
MFRAIIAAVKPAASQKFVVDFTTTLAQKHRMQIDAYSVIDEGRIAGAQPVPIGGSAFKAHRDEQFLATARQYAAEQLSAFATASSALGIECQTQMVEGAIEKVLSAAAQRCDLLVCGHTTGGDASEQSLLYSILKHSPRPAIVVPQAEFAWSPNVLIAYDGSVQAARVLASFVASGLAEGRKIHLASFDAGTGEAQARAETAQAFLHRHGISCDVHVGKLTKDAGSQVLDAARQISAGLVVMGSFGRSAIREFFIGSVTRSMLSELSMPVFLDH